MERREPMSADGQVFGIDQHGYKIATVSLRDYFAAAALTGIASTLPISELASTDPASTAWYAARAYALADAMLAVRGGK